MANKTTGKQQSFVEHLCGDCRFNATEAAIRAGYSPRTATVIASQNLTKFNVIQAIAKEMDKRREKTDVDTTEIIRELRKLAFGEIQDKDKIRALELLGKYKAMWIDKQVTIDEVQTLTARERAEAEQIAKIRLKVG